MTSTSLRATALTAAAAAVTVATAAALLPVGSAVSAQDGARGAVASIDPARDDRLAGLRVLARADDSHAQFTLAWMLADGQRRGGADAPLVEAAHWAGEAWMASAPVAPETLAAFVASHCGQAAIARHWVCTEGE